MNFAKRELALGALLLGMALCSTTIWGSTIRDDRTDAEYLNLAASPEYDCVGSIVSTFNGSGVLIAPDWVLTAAHNVLGTSTASFTINGTTYSSSQVYRHPSWTGESFVGYDIGLVHLSTPVLNITPATLYTGTAEVGQVATLLGFGFTGTGLTGWSVNLDTKKRAFQNVIDGDFGNPSILLGCDFDNPHNPADNAFGDATPQDLEGAVAPGDSGGGVFVKFGSQTYLAGVIAFVAAPDANANSDYGDISGFARVSTLSPWILTIVPEPSPLGLFATGLGVFCWRWRRARK